MDILIVGAGNMARGIATRLLAGGHPVHIAAPDVQQAQALAADLDGDATGHLLSGPGDAGIVILAVPYPINVTLATEWGDDLADRIVVDIANPVDFSSMDALVTAPGRSSAEEVADAAPSARVVKAFNTTFAKTLAAVEPLDVFIAGDDASARQTIARLVDDGGMRGIDVGHLKHARELEGFQLLHMMVQDQIGGGFATRLTLDPG